MFNVCPKCGIYSVDKTVLPGSGWRAVAVCGGCGYTHPFLRLPLWVVTGASGVGKTTIALTASARGSSFIHLESDILWRAEFNRPENNYQDYREVWLRMAKNIHQAGKPVVLYGSVTPEQFESCLERRYFARIYYLALVCSPEELTRRLISRPGWRASGSEQFIQAMQEFNDWFLRLEHPAVDVFDTGQASTSETAERVISWAAKNWTFPKEDITQDD